MSEWAMWASKHIVVDRSDQASAVKSLKRAKERMAAGISVVVFAEGTRSRDSTLLPFKKGGFLLALQSGAAVVPVTINGSGALLPVGSWRLRQGSIEVTVGEAIPVDGFGVAKLRELADKVREQIAAHLRSPATTPDSTASSVNQPEISQRMLEKQSP